MSATTGRLFAGIVVAVCLLALGGLEMVTREGLPGGVGGELSSAHLADTEVWEEPGASPSQLTASVQMERQTVLDVDPDARRFLSRTDAGHVLVSEVDTAAVVVTEHEQATGLTLLKPGDVIAVEAPQGHIQRIVVLRNGEAEEVP